VHFCVGPAGADPQIAAHTLLLALAGTLVDNPTLSHDRTGRPHVPGLAVSITRTQHYVGVAATYDGPLGLDLEEVRPRDFAPLANRWFTPRELAWIDRSSDPLEAFLRLWTGKEAVGKALGLGLRNAGLRRQMPLPDAHSHAEPHAHTEPHAHAEPHARLSAQPHAHSEPHAGSSDSLSGSLRAGLRADVVPDEPGLAVIQLGPEELGAAVGPAVLTIAASAAVAELVRHPETVVRGRLESVRHRDLTARVCVGNFRVTGENL
jgi:phosphopantetheinyl transferase (holo-ACP synthase)